MATGRDGNIATRSTRGVLVITGAKAWFLVTGFAQPLFLTALLGQTGYGVYGLVLAAISILNNVVVAGSIQAMSRAITKGGTRALRRGLLLHVALGVVLAGGFAALAHPIGVGVYHRPHLVPLLRLAAIIVGNYSVYAALVGALNGQQRFTAQAGLDITFATLRTALIIGLASTAYAVAGAIAGFAVASGVIMLVALVVVLRSSPADAPAPDAAPRESFGAFARAYAGFFAPVLLYQLALNIVLQVDLLVLGALLVRSGLGEVRSDALIGVYKCVQNFAFLPYQLLLAVTFVVFPVVSRATLEGDRDAARRFVRTALRFSTLALGGLLCALIGLPAGVLRLAYAPAIAVGAPALRILSLGQGAFALSVIASTIVLAAGRTRAATLLVLTMLVLVLVGDVVGISLADPGVASLSGAALGTAGGCVVGLCVIGLFMRRTYGAFVPAATFARVALAAIVAAGLVAIVPLHGKLITLVLAVVAVAVYVLLIVLSGEFTAAERAAVRGAIARRLGRS